MVLQKEEDMVRFMSDLLEAWNYHEVDEIAAFYAPDYEGTDIAEGVPQKGREGIQKAFNRYFAAFPDLQFSKEKIIVQGDDVVLQWTANGTHRGPLLNIPASGRKINLRGVSIFVVKNRLICQGIHIWDLAGFLRNIGLLPELSHD